MSYVGICGTDNISSTRDLRFHNGSYNEITASLAANAACTTNPATGDNIPTVSAGTAKTIPKQTPFTLTATGTDPDASDIPNLRFIWEQLDAGGRSIPTRLTVIRRAILLRPRDRSFVSSRLLPTRRAPFPASLTF